MTDCGGNNFSFITCSLISFVLDRTRTLHRKFVICKYPDEYKLDTPKFSFFKKRDYTDLEHFKNN